MNAASLHETTHDETQENQVKDGMFQAQLELQKAEEYVLKFLHNNDIKKEFNDENSMLKEDVGHLIGKTEVPRVFEMNDGHYAVVKVTEKKKEVLDKEGLALHLGIEVDELKTPLDFVMLTKQGKLLPETIKAFMVTNEVLNVSIRKSKSNPLKNKKESKFDKDK